MSSSCLCSLAKWYDLPNSYLISLGGCQKYSSFNGKKQKGERLKNKKVYRIANVSIAKKVTVLGLPFEKLHSTRRDMKGICLSVRFLQLVPHIILSKGPSLNS